MGIDGERRMIAQKLGGYRSSDHRVENG